MTRTPEHILTELFETAVERCHPCRCMVNLPVPKVPGRTLVVAAGKAAAPMAAVYEQQGHPLSQGLIVSPDPSANPVPGFSYFQASHPVPDERSVKAAQKALEAASTLGAADQLVLLLSGGASALLAAPAPGLGLAAKRALTEELLASGATIEEINTVRKHLSCIKGGRLAETAKPARVITFAISDVTGNDPATIASGPTWPDPSTSAEAADILERYKIRTRAKLIPRLMETPALDKADYHLIAAPENALEAAEQMARAEGLAVQNLGAEIKGEAKDVAHQHAALVLKIAATGKPSLLLSGGELTVTGAAPDAIGGPNHEFALALALSLAGAPGIFGFCADTDGKDGNTGAAGAYIAPSTLARAKKLGLDPTIALETHQSGGFFARLGDTHAKGSTGTNVNDFRALLINPALNAL